MNQEPLVSVIIPVYKRKGLILTALKSLCASSYRNLEILALDDGSTDGTLEAVQKAALEDSRIKAVALEHGGVSKTRNAGLDMARGKYAFFMDSDDLIHPRLLETQVEMLESQRVDAVMTTSSRFTEHPPLWNKEEVPETMLMDPGKARWSFFREQGLFKQTAGMMILREHVAQERFDTDLEFAEDTLFTYRLIRKGYSWGCVMSGWYAYRKHAVSLTLAPTEHGVWSRIEALERIFFLERKDGPTPGSRTLLGWMSYYHTLNWLHARNHCENEALIRSWLKDKRSKGLYKEIPLKNRIILHMIQSNALSQKVIRSVMRLKYAVFGPAGTP